MTLKLRLEPSEDIQAPSQTSNIIKDIIILVKVIRNIMFNNRSSNKLAIESIEMLINVLPIMLFFIMNKSSLFLV